MKAPRLFTVMQLLMAGTIAAALTCATPAACQTPGIQTSGSPTAGQPAGSAAASIANGSIFVKLLIEKRELYVGESVPVIIQVGAQDDVVASLDSPPSLRGDAFTLNLLAGEPEREQRVIDGKPCTLLAWHSLLAAVKPGTLSLSIEAPLTVRVPVAQHAEPNYADESTGDPYSDPAFQSLLQTSVAQAVVASSESVSFHVLALPTEDRPAGFGGAVGRFKISTEVSKDQTLVGEPLTLRLHVIGAGNFDRISSPMLGDTKDWKSYRPTASFAPAENTGFRGEKIFEQAVVATAPGTRSVPALEFSYFDPQTRRYEVARTAPLSVEVAPGPATAAPLAANTSPTDAAQQAATGRISSLVRGDHAAHAAAADSLLPLYLQPRFLSVPVLLIVAFTGVWFKRVRSDHVVAEPSASAAAAAATGQLLLQMEQAADAGDSARFFRSASRALLLAGVVEHDSEVRELLQLVDEANYAGELPPGADLQRCRRVVLRCLSARSGT